MLGHSLPLRNVALSRLQPLRFTVLAAVALFSTPLFALPPAAETGLCSLDNAAPATLAVIDEDFEFLLDDGRRVALAGLEIPASATVRAAAARKLSDWLAGRQVFVSAQSPDRWGRAPALLFAARSYESDAPLISVGAAVLEEGFARFRPDLAGADCASTFLAAEGVARAARRGLWSSAGFTVYDLRPDAASRDRAASAIAASKGMVIVEGVIHSVGEARGTVYLNFGPRRGTDLAVVISKREMAMFDRSGGSPRRSVGVNSKRELAIFERSGVSPRRLTGRHVRVRGLIETTFGPRMELSSPAQIEILDPEPPP
jgi:endonuclease YncB( thermonuclease family)